jgi:hypothetical protein
MGKVYVINGGVLATTGNLYTRDISAGDGRCPDGAIVITPLNGVWEITKDTGSIFDTYFVKGFVTASGIDVGDIFAFKNIYQFTIDSYNKSRDLLKNLLLRPPEDTQLRHIFYQQQYAHVFSLMERFLGDTFVRQTCDNEESYHRVLDSGILVSKNIVQGKTNRAIIAGEDCLDKELLYINSIENYIVYHKLDLVSELFSIAFNISIDLGALKNHLDTRHDIIHRFGQSTKGAERTITEADVLSLIETIDGYVKTITEQMSTQE